MTQGRPYPHWPGGDDRIVVEEMLRDSRSGQWNECHEFVKRLVQVQAKNIPRDHWDDIVQDAMMRINKYLRTFRYQCKLRTWLFNIVRSCIIDSHRKFISAGQFVALPADSHDDAEHEDDVFTTNTSGTVEDECITRDELNKALTALWEYVSTHAHSMRNGRILDMVMFEDRSLEETAKAVGCSAPVVGYVVREAQRYVREKLGHQR